MIVKFKGAIKIGLQKFQTISTYEEFCLTFGNCYACLGDIQNTEINPKKQKQKQKKSKWKWKWKWKEGKNLTVIGSTIDVRRQAFILATRKMVALQNSLFAKHWSSSLLHNLLWLLLHRHCSSLLLPLNSFSFITQFYKQTYNFGGTN